MNNENSAITPRDTRLSIPDYELLRVIGQGSYGEVWLARDQSGAYRACKIIRRERFDHQRPYEREYSAIRKFEIVSHTNSSHIKLLHIGELPGEGGFYYIMELADDVISGQSINPDTYIPKTIKTVLAGAGRVPVSDCLRIGVVLAVALEDLHAHGLIHRDVKPANIIFVNDLPKLADIGLLTESNMTVSYVGTEGFIPPEGPTSPQADIYSLGKVLYEMSTGRDRLDFPELPDDLETFPGRDKLLELNSVITKACETDFRRRYNSAKEMRMDLALLNNGKSIRRQRVLKRRVSITIRAGLICLFLSLFTAGIISLSKRPASVPASPQGHEKAKTLQVPSTTEITRREKEIREGHEKQLAAADKETKIRIAKELLSRSIIMDDMASQMGALRLSATLAVEAGEFRFATDVCETLGQRFSLSPFDLKREILSLAHPRVEAPEENKALAETCISAAFSAIAADSYEHAIKFNDLARSATQHASDASLPTQIQILEQRIIQLRHAYGRVKNYTEILHENPTNVEANMAWGNFLCFEKNDWEAGLPILSRGQNNRLKDVVKQEIVDPPSEANDQARLGRQWWQLGESASGTEGDYFRRRARFWFLKAITTANEPDKTELKRSLAEYIQQVPTEPGTVRISAHVGDLVLIDLYSDHVRWRSRGLASNSKMNHLLLGNFNRGETKMLKNCGTSWMFSDRVDFSTAKLTVISQSKSSCKTSLLSAEDHVTVQLLDPEAGFSDFDIVVSFGEYLK